MKKHLLFLVVCAAMSLNVLGQSDPSISMKVVNCLNKPSENSAVCTLSNLERIQIDIVLNFKGNENLVELGRPTVNPAVAPNTPYFVVRVIDDRTGEEVPIKASTTAAGTDNKKALLSVNVEVPEAAEVRKRKIQKFLNRIKTQDLASGAANQNTIDEASKKNGEIVSALDHYYLENRVGRFRILVEFHSSTAVGWSGVVKSAEVPVEILNKGNGLDSFGKKQ